MDNIFADDYFEVAEESLRDEFRARANERRQFRESQRKINEEYDKWKKYAYNKCKNDPRLRTLIREARESANQCVDYKFDNPMRLKLQAYTKERLYMARDILYKDKNKPESVGKQMVFNFIAGELMTHASNYPL